MVRGKDMMASTMNMRKYFFVMVMLVVNDETISCEENCTDDYVLSRQQIMNIGGLYTYAAPRRLCVGERCNYAPQYLAVWGLVYGGEELPKTTKCTLCLLLEHLHSQEQVILFILVTLSAPWPLGPSRRPPGPETLKTPLLTSWDPKGVPLTPETENLFGWIQWESCSLV